MSASRHLLFGTAIRGGACCLLLGLVSGCLRQTESAGNRSPATSQATRSSLLDDLGAAPAARSNSPQSGAAPLFSDAAGALGLSFLYESGPSQLLMVQQTGGGCGWLDFDRDGNWDLYLVQGGDASLPAASSQPNDCLFRNLSDLFVDISSPADIEERGYGQGVAIGDFDNDGFDDIYVTNVGANSFFHNHGDGTFENIALVSGTAGAGWSSSAAWADLDRDGDLDLYVCKYVDYDPFHPQICHNARGVHVQCQPNQVAPVPDEMYWNLGDGHLSAGAQHAGLSGPGNRALGVAVADFDNDEWPDVYVANDATANFLFLNRHDRTFVESAQLLGCAVGADGAAQASMGVAVADYDRNGFLDLYVTHFEGEWNTLYQNLGPAGFHDVTGAAGLVKPTMPWVGFGTVMADFNQDGEMDLFVANGHLRDLGRDPVLRMPPLLFCCRGERWQDCGELAGPYFRQLLIGRGVAEADLDNDGDWDLAVVHQETPAALLRNDSERGHWLKLELVGRESNRRGIGARIVVQSAQGEWIQEIAGGLSYCAARQPAAIFGFGSAADSCDVTIRWPGGRVQKLTGVAVDQSLQLVEPDHD